MPKSDNSSTLNTLGTLGALGVLGAGGYAGYKHYKKKQQEERKKAAIRNAILGTVGGTAVAGGAAYGGLKYLQNRNAKALENFKNLEFLTGLDNNIDKLDRLAKQHLPLGVDPIVPDTSIDTSGLHPKPDTSINVMGVKVKPERVSTGTVSFADNIGEVPNPAGYGGAHSKEKRQERRKAKKQRAKRPEVQARREARKAKELAHQQRMAEQSRLHKLETKNLKSGNKAVKTLINAGYAPKDAVELVVTAKSPRGIRWGAADALLENLKPNKAKVRIPGRSGAKLRGRARVNAFKAGKKVLSALT